MNSSLGVTATTDMAVLPGVLGCRLLRRTVQVRLGTSPAVARDGFQVARPSSWVRDSNLSNIRARDDIPWQILDRLPSPAPGGPDHTQGN